jgi:hypothetical protein
MEKLSFLKYIYVLPAGLAPGLIPDPAEATIRLIVF